MNINSENKQVIHEVLIADMQKRLYEDGKGIMRILVHIFCILLLLPIPLVVREYKEFKPKEILSFKEKSKLLNGIQTFSLYSWILTSIIALSI